MVIAHDVNVRPRAPSRVRVLQQILACAESPKLANKSFPGLEPLRALRCIFCIGAVCTLAPSLSICLQVSSKYIPRSKMRRLKIKCGGS